MDFLIAAILGYLLGSVPFGLVLTRLAGYGDIRKIGSGNIGATNVLRTGNKPLALATLILDSGKGALVVMITYLLLGESSICQQKICTIEDPCICLSWWQQDIQSGSVNSVVLLASLCALLGHLFPVWLKFKGGKGVATTLGTLIALKPVVGLCACALWLLTALMTRYSSLSALVAVALTPVVAHFVYDDANFTAFCGFVATLVFFKHRENIKRLMNKQEPKIGEKKKDDAPQSPSA